MKKWIWSGSVLALALVFAAVAYVWQPLWRVAVNMRGQSARARVWSMHGEGLIFGTRLTGDLVKRTGGAIFLRLSYPLVRVINNQWIALNGVRDNSGAGVFPHLSLHLTKKLPAVVAGGIKFKRVAFSARQSDPRILPGADRVEGVLWFAKWDAPPTRVDLRIFTALGKVGELQLEMSYIDRFGTAPPPPSRSLAEVVVQLGDIARSKANAPKRVPSLGQGTSVSAAFASDFDQDGLSDGLELFYGTDAANPDTDNDTMLDGEEVRQGLNPVGLNQ